MPGYQLTEVDRRKIDLKHLCPECNDILKGAVQTVCGHHFCDSCLQQRIEKGQIRCLTCDAELNQKQPAFPDRFSQREIQSIPVHCLNTNEGCKWFGELRHRQVHESDCDFGEIGCLRPECKALVRRIQLVDHLENECDYRKVQCAHCCNHILAIELEEHEKESCPSAPVPCPSKCEKTITRSQLAAHLDPVTGDCPQLTVPCPFANAGCSENKDMKLNERKAHMGKATVEHITILLIMVLQLASFVEKTFNDPKFRKNGFSSPIESMLDQIVKQIEGVFRENDELKNKFRQHTDRLGKLELKHVNEQEESVAATNGARISPKEMLRRVNNQEAKTADLEVLLVEANRLIENLTNQNTRQQSQLESAHETIRRLERRLESHDHVLAMRNMALADLEESVRQQQVSSYDGALLWKITDFAKRKNDAISGKQASFYSPCFYTSRHGYKMCARIYLNGDGMGKGTHVSVFFVVMRGQFDALLRWPFRQKVTIMLLDQDNAEHVIDAFRPDVNSPSFQRPRREMNVASGCPLFCSLVELNKHAYVRDDTMFMKIIVDTSDL